MITDAVERALESIQPRLLEEADRQSAGTLTRAELRRRDHPYARRHGRPQAPLLPINEQGGAFRAAWSARIERQGTLVSLTGENTAPHAVYLERGTRFMFARPLPEAVIDTLLPEVEAAVLREIEKELAR